MSYKIVDFEAFMLKHQLRAVKHLEGLDPNSPTRAVIVAYGKDTNTPAHAYNCSSIEAAEAGLKWIRKKFELYEYEILIPNERK